MEQVCDIFNQLTTLGLNVEEDILNPICYCYRDRTQKSRRIKLRRGRIYFMEVVMKEGGGGDHVSVGVRKPRSKRIRPVSKRDIFVRPPSKKICLYHNVLEMTY